MGHANACTTTIAGHCLNLYTAAIVVTTSFLARKEGSFPKSQLASFGKHGALRFVLSCLMGLYYYRSAPATLFVVSIFPDVK